MVRLSAAAAMLLLSVGLAQGREATAPKTQPAPEASAIDPLNVPRGMHDWFAKTVDDILTDDDPAKTKSVGRH